MSTDRYVSPLSERYASKEMQYIFSPDMKALDCFGRDGDGAWFVTERKACHHAGTD